MDNIDELEEKLEKAKQAKQDKDWKNLSDQYDRIGKWVIGKEFIQFYTRYSWAVLKINEYHHQYYIDSSGFYGQWDKCRYFTFIGERFGMQVSHNPTDVLNTADINLNQVSIGIPLKKRENWVNTWKKFISLGEVSFDQLILSIGEKSYKKRDIEDARRSLTNFQCFLRLAPDGMFDELREAYIERVKLGYKLQQKYSEDRKIVCKKIDWDTEL